MTSLLPAAALVSLVGLAACGVAPASPGADDRAPEHGDTGAHGGSGADDAVGADEASGEVGEGGAFGDLEFTACARTSADPASTNLRPSPLSASDRAVAAELDWVVPDGRLVLESVTDLTLVDGVIGFGNGYDAATGSPPAVAAVADATVTAPVTFQVLDSPTSGRRVAFVEVRLSEQVPVTWTEARDLAFVTDGGDGGIVAAHAPSADVPTGDEVIDAYIDAFYPDSDSTSGNVCVLRRSGGVVDAVLFSAGWGDGVYPTYLGKDADGEVVSVVSHGFVVPWVLSGLPGEPPHVPGESMTP